MATETAPITVSELRETYRDVFDAATKGKRFEVLCNGEVVGYIIGPSEWKMMNETVEILANLDLLKQVIQSERDADTGEDFDVVFDEIEAELDDD